MYNKPIKTNESQDTSSLSSAEPMWFQRVCSSIMHQNFLSLDFAGRSLLGIAFIAYGYSFFYYMQGNTIYMPDFIPFQLFWLMLTGSLLTLAGLCLILKVNVRVISLFIAGMYSIISLLVYLFDSNLQTFFLNIAIIGGLLIMANNHK